MSPRFFLIFAIVALFLSLICFYFFRRALRQHRAIVAYQKWLARYEAVADEKTMSKHKWIGHDSDLSMLSQSQLTQLFRQSLSSKSSNQQ